MTWKSVVAVAVAAVSLLGLLVTESFAASVPESDLGPRVNLVPVKPPEGTAQRGATSPQRYRISVPNGSYALMRNGPAGYFIGNLRNGDTFDSVRNNDGTWYMGLGYGSFSGCGWLLANNINQATGTASGACSTWGASSNYSMPTSDFIGTPSCPVNTCSGPRRTYVSQTAGFCSNVKPWLNPVQPTNCDRGVTAGKCLEWRYTTKDGQWVAVKDRAVADENGGWGFVNRGALPTLEQGPALAC